MQQHLRTAVRHGLEGPHRDPELLALLDVVEGHLQRALAHAHDLGGDRGAHTIGGVGRQRLALAAHGGEPPGGVDGHQRLTQLAADVVGPEALTAGTSWSYELLRARGNTIEGGTTEVLKNIVAERVLGLPKAR